MKLPGNFDRVVVGVGVAGVVGKRFLIVLMCGVPVTLPCHTIAVERGVKETTAGVLRTADPVLQDGATFMISKSGRKTLSGKASLKM